VLCRSDLHGFFTRQRERVKEGLHGGLSEAPLALMGLASLNSRIQRSRSAWRSSIVSFLAEGDAIKLVEHGLVEALDDAVIRYEIRRRLAVRLFPKGRRRYGEPIRDEHEGAGRPPIDIGLRARARYMAAPCDFPGWGLSGILCVRP
jgi:hypothetical protein